MLKPGDSAPLFDLPCAIDNRLDRVNLGKLDAAMVVLFFYPHDFSFVCPTEVTAFHQTWKDFRAEDTAVLGASVDDAESHLRWARELGGICYPLLADEAGKVARAYGIFDEQEGVANRATFILDRRRIVEFSVACPINVGRSVAETLRIVRAIRTGRLCPAEWKPGVEFGPPDRKY